MAAIVERHGPAFRVADFGEIEADAIDLADAVVLSRDGVRDIHAHGPGVIGDSLAHRRRIQSADPAGPQPQSRKCVGHVVFAAADPDFERRRELDSPMCRRRKANHAFAERDQIELATICWLNIQSHCLLILP